MASREKLPGHKKDNTGRTAIVILKDGVNHYDRCATKNDTRTRSRGELVQRVTFDILGLLPRMKSGNKYRTRIATNSRSRGRHSSKGVYRECDR